MTYEQIRQYLESLPLAKALWWFIENITPTDANRDRVFFYLRERIRSEQA